MKRSDPPNGTVFENGLTVLTYPTEVKSLFFFQLVVKAGVLQQNPKHIGYAHFFEHLMSFYPSEKYPDSLANQNKINELGIEMNAWTDDDNCGYYMCGLEEHKDYMLDLLFNVLWRPLWKSNNTEPLNEVFEQERGAVLRELAKYIDDPWYDMNTQMTGVLYNKTNMACSVKDELKNVKDPKRLNMKTFSEFYDEFYKPDFMTLSIITSTSSNKILKQLRTRYSEYLNFKQVGGSSGKIIIPTPKPKPEKVYFMSSKMTEEYRIVTVIRLPKFTFFDLEASIVLDMISTILTGGLSSRLYRVLRSELGAVYNVTSELNLDYRCGEYSYFWIETMTNQKCVKRVIQEIEKHLKQFHQPTREEYEQIKNQIELKYKETTESTTFKKSFEECNDYQLWGQKCVTEDEFHTKQLKILNEEKKNHNIIQRFVNENLANDIYIFYSGKKRLI